MKSSEGIMAPPVFNSVARSLGLVLLLLALIESGRLEAQVWSCSEGYTNNPVGKTDCQVSGAIAACGKNGSRYFAPRRGSNENLSTQHCSPHRSVKTSLIDAFNQGYDSIAQSDVMRGIGKLPTRLRSKPERGKAATNQGIRIGEPQIEDVFSCFSAKESLGNCSFLDLGHFVESALNQAGDALK